jgi:hypothetical protein
MKPQGWYRDPFGVHQDRYFSDGNPTKLVRDGAAEAYDEPPPGPLPGPLVEIPPSEPEGSSGLRRADDCERKPGMPAIEDPAMFYGPVN